MGETDTIPGLMTALELRGAGFDAISVVERPVPRPGPHQALCRVVAVSVCTTDTTLVSLGSQHRSLFGWDPARHPIVPGHEGSLEVVEVGEKLGHRLRVGQRLVIVPVLMGPPRFDLDCYGESPRDICSISLGFTLPGLLAQYVLLREDILESPENLIQVSAPTSSLPHFGAALAEPFSTVIAAQAGMVHRVRGAVDGERIYRGGVLPGGVTVVIGAGPMGLMHASYALLRRPRHLVVSEPNPERRAAASRLSELAELESTEFHTVEPESLPGLVRAVTGGRGADDIIIAVGDSRVEEAALALVGPGSRVCFFGQNSPEDDVVRVSAGNIHLKSVSISGSWGSTSQDVRRALELQERGAMDMSPFISAVGGIAAAPAALRAIAEGRFWGKLVLYPHANAPELVAVEKWGPEAEMRFLREMP